MQRAQEQKLFTVTDWSVANAKLEEVRFEATLILLHVTIKPSGEHVLAAGPHGSISR